MQIWSWKKTPKNLTKICLEMVLDSILEGFGTVLGLFWALLAGSWPFKIKLFSALPLMGSKMPSGAILNRFWEGFKRNWGGFGRVYKGTFDDLWQILETLVMIGPCWGRFSMLDPRADPRSVTIF